MSGATVGTDTPRAWVGCLGCYNAGALVGEWIDATEAGDVTVADLHAAAIAGGIPVFTVDPYAATHEELWVMDHEGFDGFLSGECSPAEAQRIAERIAELEESYVPLEAVAAYCGNLGESVTDVELSDVEEAWAGEWSSEADFAQDYAEQTGALSVPTVGAYGATGAESRDLSSEWPFSYIDWEAAARELLMDYFTAPAAGGGVYIFRSF